MRVKMIAEHIQTIEKSMKQVVELGSQTPVNYNQLVRWVNNKEHHADEYNLAENELNTLGYRLLDRDSAAEAGHRQAVPANRKRPNSSMIG